METHKKQRVRSERKIPSQLSLKLPKNLNISYTANFKTTRRKKKKKLSCNKSSNNLTKTNDSGQLKNKDENYIDDESALLRNARSSLKLRKKKYWSTSNRRQSDNKKIYKAGEKEKDPDKFLNWRLDWKSNVRSEQPVDSMIESNILNYITIDSSNVVADHFKVPTCPLSSSPFYDKCKFRKHLVTRQKTDKSSGFPTFDTASIDESRYFESFQTPKSMEVTSGTSVDKTLSCQSIPVIRNFRSPQDLPKSKEATIVIGNEGEKGVRSQLQSMKETLVYKEGGYDIITSKRNSQEHECMHEVCPFQFADVGNCDTKQQSQIDSFCDKEKFLSNLRSFMSDESGRDALRNILWELVQDKLVDYASKGCVKDIESRLSHLEASDRRSRKRRKSGGSIGQDSEYSSGDEIEILEEFSTKGIFRGIAPNHHFGVKIKQELIENFEEPKNTVAEKRRLSKKKRNNHSEDSGRDSLAASTSSKKDSDSKPKDLLQFDFDSDAFAKVYTYGVSCEDGTKSAIGVWFGKEHALNVSQLIMGPLNDTTLNLQAAWTALCIVRDAGIHQLRIYTSPRVRKCIRHLSIWKQRKLRKKSGEFIKNKEQIETLMEAMSSLDIDWKVAPSHRYIVGAESARKLALSALSDLQS